MRQSGKERFVAPQRGHEQGLSTDLAGSASADEGFA